MNNRTIQTGLLWTLLLCATLGTLYLSHKIDTSVGDTASVFLGARGARHDIVLFSDSATPSFVSARPGEEIVFTVKDESHHTIAEERDQRHSARLESGDIGKDESYSLVFQGTGTYYFYDRMHQDIRVTIVVK